MDWTFVYSEANSLVANDIFFFGFTDRKNVPGMFRTLLYVNRGGIHICKAPREELDRIREEGKVFFDVSFRNKFEREIKSVAVHFDKLYEEYRTLSLGTLSNKDLLKIFRNYVECLKNMFAYYQVSGGRCYPLLETFAKEKLAVIIKHEPDVAYTLMLKNDEIDILEQEAIDLRRLAGKNSVSDSKLLHHSKKYPLLFINLYDDYRVVDSLRNRMSEYKTAGQSVREYEENVSLSKENIRKEQGKIEKQISKDNELVSILKYLRDQGRIRFEYKNWKNGAEWRFCGLFVEIAKRLGLQTEEMMLSYRVKDIEDFLSKGVVLSESERKDRQKICVFYQNDDKKIFVSGQEAVELSSELLGDTKAEIRELKGVVAEKGFVIGRARVILPVGWESLQKEMRMFEVGEILVTTMTEPNLVMVMKKASAIVTNQGGITSHAAVISRELGIPCVVGTLKATEVIKTGDLIEVDADKGVVRIIKKA